MMDRTTIDRLSSTLFLCQPDSAGGSRSDWLGHELRVR